jgi:hypothetical protein
MRTALTTPVYLILAQENKKAFEHMHYFNTTTIPFILSSPCSSHEGWLAAAHRLSVPLPCRHLKDVQLSGFGCVRGCFGCVRGCFPLAPNILRCASEQTLIRLLYVIWASRGDFGGEKKKNNFNE